MGRLVRMVCLANSYRQGGRCIAGVELDCNNQIILTEHRKPKWMRPVFAEGHEQVPENFVKDINISDIIEFTEIKTVPNSYQSENTLFESNSLMPFRKLQEMCPLTEIQKIVQPQDELLIFGNAGKAVPVLEGKAYPRGENFSSLGHSLIAIEIPASDCAISEKNYSNRAYPQKRLLFRYKKTKYDLPITDLEFIRTYASNHNLLEECQNVFITISLGASIDLECAHGSTQFAYKIVAGILIIKQ